MKKSLLVRACLLGVPCRYDGNAKPNPAVLAMEKRYTLVPVCPESLGGLMIPRPPAELVGEKVINAEGMDVTNAFQKGAEAVLQLALSSGCETAIFKSKSPSCGKGQIYDGSFSGKLIPGDGVAAMLLMEHGIRVLTEHEIEGV